MGRHISNLSVQIPRISSLIHPEIEPVVMYSPGLAFSKVLLVKIVLMMVPSIMLFPVSLRMRLFGNLEQQLYILSRQDCYLFQCCHLVLFSTA
jgi:hypothetical protein